MFVPLQSRHSSPEWVFFRMISVRPGVYGLLSDWDRRAIGGESDWYHSQRSQVPVRYLNALFLKHLKGARYDR